MSGVLGIMGGSFSRGGPRETSSHGYGDHGYGDYKKHKKNYCDVMTRLNCLEYYQPY